MSQYHLLNQHNEGYYDDDDDEDEEDNETAAASNHKTVIPKQHMLSTLPNKYFDDNYYHLNDEMKLPNDLKEYKQSFKATQVDLSPFIHNNPNNSKNKIYYNNNNNDNNNKSNNINMYNNNNNNNNNNKTMHISYEHSTSNNSFVNILDSDESALDVPLLNRNEQQQQQQQQQHNQHIDHNNVGNHCSSSNNNNINNSKRHGNNTNYNEDIPQEWLHYPCRQQGFSHALCYESTQIAKSKILAAIVVCCLFMIVEFLGGYIAGSLAIMSDAAHLASDCISFVIGLLAIWLGSRPPDDKMSFGYKRIEVMGAVASILGIWLLTATLVYAALQRLYNQDFTLDANAMLIVSAVGILINIIMILILHTPNCILPAGQLLGSSKHHHHSHNHSHNHRSSYAKAPAPPLANEQQLPKESLIANRNSLKHDTVGNVNNNFNLRAAMIHVIGDLVQSFGVFFASVLIKFYPKAGFLDPLCTLLFSIIVVLTTVHLFKESFLILIDSVPHNLCLKDLRKDFLTIEGVKSVHHLNVWHHTVNFKVLTVHLVIDSLAENELVLQKATQLVQSSKYNIKHCTIQIERL